MQASLGHVSLPRVNNVTAQYNMNDGSVLWFPSVVLAALWARASCVSLLLSLVFPDLFTFWLSMLFLNTGDKSSQSFYVTLDF